MNNRPKAPVYLNYLIKVKYIFIVLLAFSTAMVHAQRKPKIKGNRNPTEVRESLPDFHAVCLLDDLEVSLEHAADPGYLVAADDNLIDILKFEVVSDTLFISSFYTVTAKSKLEIKVLYNELSAIRVKAGSLTADEVITADELTIHTEALAKLQLKAKAPLLLLQMEEQSSGDLNLESDSLKVVLNNRANARIYQLCDNLELNMGDQSDAVIEGTSGTMTIRMKAGSKLKAERLEAETIKASLDDTATAYLRPTALLELTSRGSANTYLYGDAKISVLEFGDTSELYKRMD
jgi:hypothetical protein